MGRGERVQDAIGRKDFYTTIWYGRINGNGRGARSGKEPKNGRVPYRFIEDSWKKGRNKDVVLVNLEILAFSDLQPDKIQKNAVFADHLYDNKYDPSQRH